MATIVVVALIGLLCGVALWVDVHQREKTKTLERSWASEVHTVGSPTEVHTVGSPTEVHTVTPGVNDSFLEGVRSRSCYAVLRGVHGVITTLGIAALAVLWFVLMNAPDGNVDRIYTTVVCGLIAAALFIAYGFFRMIVDAVDVLIDTSRRKAEGNG